MKRLAMLLCLFVGLAFVVTNAQAELPKNSKELKAQIEEQAKTPEGAVNLFMDGIFLYGEADTRSLGREVFQAMIYDLADDWETADYYKRFLRRTQKQKEIFRSYCKNTSPKDNYKTDVNACERTFEKSKQDGDDGWQLYVVSTGADSSRKITLRKGKDGLWKVATFSSIYLGVRKK